MPRLETPNQFRRSEARDRALTLRARREREEVAVRRDSFELTRDKVVFGFELALAVAVVAAVVVLLVGNPDLLPVVLLGGGLGYLANFRRRQRSGRD